MGRYINTGTTHGKLEWLIANAGAELVDLPEWEEIPEGKALIVIGYNPTFEVAAYAYSKHEYDAFTDWDDSREREFLLMDKDLAEKMAL